jgi:hypothetical protein
VAGTITDQSGRSVRGAHVEFHQRQSQASFSTTTTGEGIYRLTNLPPGEYDVTVTSDGIEPGSKTLQIRAASLEVLDFQVTLTNPAPEVSSGPVGVPGPQRTARLPDAAVDIGSLPTTNRIPEPDTAPVLGAPEVVPS